MFTALDRRYSSSIIIILHQLASSVVITVSAGLLSEYTQRPVFCQSPSDCTVGSYTLLGIMYTSNPKAFTTDTSQHYSVCLGQAKHDVLAPRSTSVAAGVGKSVVVKSQSLHGKL